MKHEFIDLRSDTITQPSEIMRDIIRNAEVGDELYNTDPTTLKLEQYCAAYFNKEAAVFLPSGIMGNQIAIRCHTKPGDKILLDRNYHIYYYESGPTSDLAKVTMYCCDNNEGIIDTKELSNVISNRHKHDSIPEISLVCIENTINALAGK